MVLRKGIAMIPLWRVDTLAPINSRLQMRPLRCRHPAGIRHEYATCEMNGGISMQGGEGGRAAALAAALLGSPVPATAAGTGFSRRWCRVPSRNAFAVDDCRGTGELVVAAVAFVDRSTIWARIT
jgi:hypothetical protein